MKTFLALTAVAVLGLTACGSGADDESGSPSPSTEPVAQAALPDVARIVCDADGARIETPSVKPQGDGIHVEIVNETGSERVFSLESQGSGGSGGGVGFPAPPGTTTEIVDLGPGVLTAACSDPAVEPPPGEQFEVMDEDGVWVSTGLTCAEQFSQVSDYAAGATGEFTDPLEAARKAIEGFGLEPDDVFEPAGYPDTDVSKVRLVRGGETLAIVDLYDDGSGKWLVGMVTGCTSLEQGANG